MVSVPMATVLDWRRAEDPRDIVHQAVQGLTEGRVVVLPTDTCYLLIANPFSPSAVGKLQACCGSKLCILPRSADEVLDFVPNFGRGAMRLAQRVWPGPLVIQHRNGLETSSVRCFPSETISKIIIEEHHLRLWQPGHDILQNLSRLFSRPIVGGLPGKTITEVKQVQEVVGKQQYDDGLLILDAGPIEGIGVPTVVELDGSHGKLLEPGVIAMEQLQALSQLLILFVCTGNTCRSPMAAALMNQKIQSRFGRSPESVPVIATSAGVSAFGGDPASTGARQAIRRFGIQLESHQSSPLQSYLVEQADLILVMGNRHRNYICSNWPEFADKVHLVASDGGEISDPFGGPVEIYSQCAEQLDQHTGYWLDQLDASSVIQWQT